jgi:3-phenylpropionate/trans-cinnamate dioxygenase ferredoxin reductase component
MNTPSSVLIVGASLGGLTVAESLRREGYAGAITLLGAERHTPYDRPPLSKKVLAGSMEPEKTALRSPTAISQLQVDLHLGEAAVRLDVPSRSVSTTNDRTLQADVIVIATGLEPRRLASQDSSSGVHVFRTVDDATRLRAALIENKRLVIVGDGVLGTEIAATARSLGVEVTLVGPQQVPLASQLGPFVGGCLAKLHTNLGVNLRLGIGVKDVVADDAGRASGVRLENDEVIPGDLVVVAIGSRPATDWLVDSGLELNDGIVCDDHLRSAESIYAVGDVANFFHSGINGRLRLENRTNAVEQAMTVAANIVGKDKSYAPVPFFWTDQGDTKIQTFGLLQADAEVRVVEGDPEKNQFVALYGYQGKVIGAAGWNSIKTIRTYRQMVVDSKPWAEL